MNSSEHSKIVEPSWSGRADVPARPIIFPNTSARLPVADIPTRPNHAIPCNRGGLSPKTLRRVQDHIAANLGQKISNQALAEVAKLSPAHFAEAFKDSQGVAPHRYILECRVKRSQELLATDMPLSQIAVDVGFSDQSHLTRWFGEFVGVTPGSYRRSMR
jgi:transcriptional regulator GlxA family with amidase domain